MESKIYLILCAKEVAWYRQHGKHKDRIRTDRQGVDYVIGDWSWNRLYPERKEFVDEFMEQL